MERFLIYLKYLIQELNSENCLNLIFASPRCEKVIIVLDTNYITFAIRKFMLDMLSPIDILYIILKGILLRFGFNLNFERFSRLSVDFRELQMGPFRPIFGNFDENQTRRKQTNDISFSSL